MSRKISFGVASAKLIREREMYTALNNLRKFRAISFGCLADPSSGTRRQQPTIESLQHQLSDGENHGSDGRDWILHERLSYPADVGPETDDFAFALHAEIERE